MLRLFSYFLFGWLCFLGLLLLPTAVSAAPLRAPAQPATDIPPLPRGCGISPTPIEDFSQVVCCVSGYVYLNGAPVAGATVTVSANGGSVTTQTATGPLVSAPYFAVSLSSAPLNVKPGDSVTISDTSNGQTKSKTFVAQPGGQQVDVVLPQDQVEGAWQRAGRFIPRTFPALAYDAARQRVVLFGGNNYDYYTWEWDGSAWEQLKSSNSPGLRWGHAMAYDAERKRVVLLGGYEWWHDKNTWEWDGKVWQQITPPNAPSLDAGQAMVYDPVRKRVVLFGGRTTEFGESNETWEWNGTTWEQRTPIVSPTGRTDYSLAYDVARQRVVLFGGYKNNNGNGTWLNDTWEWDGDAWVEIFPPTSPSPRQNHAAVYDPGRQKIILFGGFSGDPFIEGSYFYETWEWDGVNWSKLNTPATPSSIYSVNMVHDVAHNTTLLLTSDLYNSSKGGLWELVGNNWVLREDYSSNPALTPPLLQGTAFSYAGSGQSLLFGGRIIDSTGWETRTFGWNGTQWQALTLAQTPPVRQNHRLAYNPDTNTVLLFGGTGADGQLRNDTWLWGNGQWTPQTPALSPSPRTLHAMTYDSQRKVWALFGGQDNQNYLGDTWEYNGVNWVARTPANAPPPRSGATLTYNPARQRAVLIGGRSQAGYRNDVWEWDGTNWTEIPQSGSRPLARAMHNAAYDPAHNLILVAGGQTATQVFTDTWAWRDNYWQPHNTARWDIPTLDGQAMTYDAAQQRVIAFAGGDDSDHIYPYQIGDTPAAADPIATISRISPRDATQGVDTLSFTGSGADADFSDTITAYRWTLAGAITGTVLSTQASFTVTASALPLGAQTIGLAVQDDEGTWSTPVQQTIYIRDPSGGIPTGKRWTLLLYIAADNNLDAYLNEHGNPDALLRRLKVLPASPNVQIGVLFDGRGVGDSVRYVRDASGAWSETPLGELAMDNPTTLRDFVRWGYTNFTSDYYALALIDHANGVVGFGQDDTSDASGGAFLTPLELRTALQDATDDGAHQIDVLHFDGCSFGLLEDAAIARGLAKYVVASANTGWGIFAHDLYVQLAANVTSPRAFAQQVAETYATQIATQHLPYTIAAFDMTRFEAVNTAVGNLGDALLAYATTGDAPQHKATLNDLRKASQKYDAGGQHVFSLDEDDSYVDLVDLVAQLQAGISAPSVIAATATVSTTVLGATPFVLYQSHASGQFPYGNENYSVDLTHAHGLGLFYPPGSVVLSNSAYQEYIQNRLFDTTRDSGWRRFLEKGLPPALGPTLPLTNDHLIAPLSLKVPTAAAYQAYLPLVRR